MIADEIIGGHNVPEAIASLIWLAVENLAKTHNLKHGTTSLYWNLIHTIEAQIEWNRTVSEDGDQ